MSEKIINYINNIFASYEENKNLSEYKLKIIDNLQEKYSDLRVRYG